MIKGKRATLWKANRHEEHDIQVSFVSWYRMQWGKKYPKSLFAIPNGSHVSGENPGGGAPHTKEQKGKNVAIRRKRLKDEGLELGVADLFLSIPSGDYAGMYIETKIKTGTSSDAQKEFRECAITYGYAYVIIRSAYEGSVLVNDYLSGAFSQQAYDAKKAVKRKPERQKRSQNNGK